MFIKMEGLWKNGIRSTPFFSQPHFCDRRNKSGDAKLVRVTGEIHQGIGMTDIRKKNIYDV